MSGLTLPEAQEVLAVLESEKLCAKPEYCLIDIFRQRCFTCSKTLRSLQETRVARLSAATNKPI